MKLNYKTRDDVLPNGKPRVFFCSTEEDYRLYFDEIVQYIRDTIDCAVYYLDYSADKENEITYEELFDLLKEMQLVIVPVTSNFLHTSNDAKDKVIPYLDGKKRIIPIILEDREGVPTNDFKEVFGKRQFLDKTEKRDQSADTQEPFEVKFKRVLKEALIEDELAEEVRAAFDAHIFLSYRKKDRKYAQELMRLIHSDSVCENIAIWYDEFLVPGENYEASIMSAISKCDGFVFSVTNSFTEKDNYVMKHEYPDALKTGNPMIPVNMQNTDENELAAHFDGIEKKLIKFDDKDKVCYVTADSIKNMVHDVKSGNPRHAFLLGLAYLDGIDVEVNEEKGEELLEKAANEGVPEAMEKLAQIYYDVKFDIYKAIEWQNKAVDEYKALLEKDDTDAKAFERFKNSVKLLKSMYDCNADEKGTKSCVDSIEIMGKQYAENALKSPDEYREIFNQMEYLRLSAAVWCGKDKRRDEIVDGIGKDYEKFFKQTKCVEDASAYMDILCELAEKAGSNMYNPYNKVESFKALFKEELPDSVLCNTYIRVCNAFIKREKIVCADMNMKIDREFIKQEFGWWTYAENAYSICCENIKKNTDDAEWIKLYRESMSVLARGIFKLINIYPPLVIAQELQDEWKQYSEKVEELYLDAYKKNELSLEEKYSCIDFLIEYAYCDNKLTPNRDTLEEKYKAALNMAEKTAQITKTRESEIYYWNKLYFCAKNDLDSAKKAVNLSRQMVERDGTVQAKDMLAKSLSCEYHLTSDIDMSLKEAIAINEQLAVKELGIKKHYGLEMQLLSNYKDAYYFSNAHNQEKDIVDYLSKYLKLATKMADEDAYSLYKYFSDLNKESKKDFSDLTENFENNEYREIYRGEYAGLYKLRNDVAEINKINQQRLAEQRWEKQDFTEYFKFKTEADGLRKNKKYDEALRIYKKLFEADAGIAVHIEMFECMNALKLYSEMISVFPDVIEDLQTRKGENTEYSRVCYEKDIANAYMEEKQYENARKHILTAKKHMETAKKSLQPHVIQIEGEKRNGAKLLMILKSIERKLDNMLLICENNI